MIDFKRIPPDKKTKNFIKLVAEDFGIYNLSEEDIKRAHVFAGNYDNENYYYRVKEFFTN